MPKFTNLKPPFIAIFLFAIIQVSIAQVVPVGSGSYTLTFPGTDVAGRNNYPSGTPFVTGNAVGKPIPTNDWWSAKIKNPHCDNLFNYPFTQKTVNEGLVVSYIPWGVIDNILPVIVGVSGLNASSANVSDYSDWTVSINWSNSNHSFTSTSGIGMPFLYFTKNTSDVAQITVNEGTATINNEKLIIENARNGADFAIYAPMGSTWIQNGNIYTSTLNGKNYWSLGFIPQNASNINTVAAAYQKYAYVFPTNTHTDWNFDEATSVVTTNFTTTVDVKEGTDSTIFQGLLPHQWNNLGAGSPSFLTYTYPTVRGELKTIESNTFSVENTFYGILPTLPYLDYYSQGFSPSELGNKVRLLENDGLATWTDSYNEGQEMNRLIQTARVAELSGDTVALSKLLKTVKNRLQDWLEVNANEVAFIFYYNTTWTAMIGYPAGHGQDGNINDHHFHWGYFIHAASFLEQYEPGWATQWGDMINLLVRDAASQNRNDNLFPFLRNFSPFAGHCWANGFASFPQGNDQESTSESMQFNSSLIHWGSVTGNNSIRDLGIYLYTTEQTAIEEYWFDQYNRNFGPNQQYSLVSRVWGNSYDNGTFWTSDIAASYGIELYPMHGGSFYLGQDTNYVKKLWNEIEQNTGILNNDPNVNLWHDLMWEYLAFIDPEKAITMYDSYPDRNLKFGVSDVQTYHWLHAMNVLGNIDISVTADNPMAVVFNKKGTKTYVAQNYSSNPITVNFSDGYTLQVPARKLVTSRDLDIVGELTSSFNEAYVGGSVELTLNVSGGTATKIEFYDGEDLIATTNAAPHKITASNLTAGVHRIFAKVYDGNNFNISNIINVTVGEQLPYSGTPSLIPGIIESAHYDLFEGGIGNGIAYQDLSRNNQGDFRPNEYVDAENKQGEGDVVGWISGGEWLEYTVDVAQAGNYNLSLRYASGNSAGGGPFRIESDGQIVKAGITVNSSGNWNTWTNKVVNGIPLKKGKQVIRLYFENGEFNLGKLTFTYDSPLTYSQPVANAGNTQVVVLPQTSGNLDASASTEPTGGNLNYLWEQVYGPSVVGIANNQAVNTNVSGLIEGVYLFKLTVDNGSFQDIDYTYVVSSLTTNIAPKVSIFSPSNNSTYSEDELVTITASASDLNDSIQRVEFYEGKNLLFVDTVIPFNYDWIPPAGDFELSAIAYDSYNKSNTSNKVKVKINQAPPCRGTSANGDFDFHFSSDDNNPSITFIPNGSGIGSPTCILYYGTDPGNMPGYLTTANTPYYINANKGDRIYFYYVYSYPGVGQKDNSADKDTYLVGSCKGRLYSNFTQAYKGGSIDLEVSGTASNTSKVEFYDNNNFISQTNQKPYKAKATNLTAGWHQINARIYSGPNYTTTNGIEVLVGEQWPFFGKEFEIPGDFYAAQYDVFEGGLGQEVSYNENSNANNGNYRKNELVNSSVNHKQYKAVNEIESEEWLEYSVNVAQSGSYSLELEYMNPTETNGFLYFESDGIQIGNKIELDTTSSNNWQTKTIGNLNLKGGKQIIRLYFETGGFKLGKLKFALNAPLSFNQPLANAGGNQFITGPTTSTSLDGSGSINPGGGSLTYLWEQVYGPTNLNISNPNSPQTNVIGLAQGVYLLRLTVSDGTNFDTDDQLIFVASSHNYSPEVKIHSPNNETDFAVGDTIHVETFAIDLNENLSRVDLYLNNNRLTGDNSYPYVFKISPPSGNYMLKALAFDNLGNFKASEEISIRVLEKSNCRKTSQNGDFDFEFSIDKENPTITFLPNSNNLGDSICFLHYGTDPNNLKVVPVSPNLPHKLEALWGTSIYIYYTYNKSSTVINTANQKELFLVGSCQTLSINELENQIDFEIYPNPVKSELNFEFKEGKNLIQVFDMNGKLLLNKMANQTHLNLDVSNLNSGVYFIKVSNAKYLGTTKIIKID